MKRVFLGGTTNNSKWRDRAIVYLDAVGIGYFDPVVKDWNEAAQRRELAEREKCDFCMYTITPKMKGVYSIAEMIDDSHKRPKKVVIVFLKTDNGERYTVPEQKSIDMVTKMLRKNGVEVFDNLKTAVDFISK